MFYTDLLNIAKEFNQDAIKVDFLRKSHNYVYKVYTTKDTIFILRLTSTLHRCAEQILSELDFQKYLIDKGASVVSPLMTRTNAPYIRVESNDEVFFAAAYSYAKGENWDERSDFTENRFFNIGKELGKIHRISKGYIPTHKYMRRQWNENQHIVKANEIFKNYNVNLYHVFTEFILQMNQLQKVMNVLA